MLHLIFFFNSLFLSLKKNKNKYYLNLYSNFLNLFNRTHPIFERYNKRIEYIFRHKNDELELSD